MLIAPTVDIPTRVLVLYASQTGQAESISEYIYSKFEAGPLDGVTKYLDSLPQNNGTVSVERTCVSKFEDYKEFFELSPGECPKNPNLLITVASTTGQGDPPDTALKFYRYLKKLQRTVKNIPSDSPLPFSHIRFALLGLGDTNYDNFAQFSKNLNRVFQELGAQCFVETKYADDAGELETVTEPFIEHLTETIANLYSQYCSSSSPTMATTKELESSLKSLQITESLPTKVPDIEKHECPYLDSDELLKSSQQFLTLRGPFEQGKDDEYRKMPVQQVNIEDNPIIGDAKLTSLLEFFQNKHKASLVYEAFAQAGPDNVLRETEFENCLHKEKVDFKVNIQFKMTPEQIQNERSFIPGDSYGIYCMNSMNDILTICKHSTLNLSVNDTVQEITLLELLTGDKQESNRIGLKFQNELYEIFEFLAFCVDSRTVIKRRDLYLLSQFASSPEESQALKELSTRKSNALYQTIILNNFVTVCDILRLFPSIKLNIYRLISMLNPAKARYFSLTDWPVIDHDKQTQTAELWITLKNNFSPFKGRNDEDILGQFSGKFFLDNVLSSSVNIFEQFKSNYETLPTLNCCEKNLSTILTHKVPIFVFLRPNTFNISMDFTRPSLFLSSGTGITPFLSFFKARDKYSKNAESQKPAKIVLFHGIRNESLIIEKVPLLQCFYIDDSLLFSFSRQEPNTVKERAIVDCCKLNFGHVPDSLKSNGDIVLKFLQSASKLPQTDQKTTDNQPQVLSPFNVYLCGGKAFQNDVKTALKSICEQSPEFGIDFWNETLVKSIKIDQW